MTDVAAQPALTPADVAGVLRISEREVRRLIRTGRLPAVVISRKCLRIDPATLDALLRGTHPALINAMPMWRVSAETFRQLRGPIVYVLRRGTEVLYVGQSVRGLMRPFDPAHHVLGALPIEPTDQLTVHPCASAAEARTVEAELITRLAPRLNNPALPGGDV